MGIDRDKINKVPILWTNVEKGFPNFDKWKEQHKEILDDFDLNEEELKEMYESDKDGYYFNLDYS